MPELKELRLKNFKSFRKAVIPFKQGFTSVIGPNGSGKSNILDAVLFVLGSTSMKSLRAGRISNLINNTTSDSYGKVEIVIKDKNQEWKISRTIDKKGKSTCRINDQKKGLGEVTSLLAELGLKSDGDNIVAQGDITRIIEMSPEQRRQIIDELAGISEFEVKRDEAEKNLSKAEERVKNANLILKERLSRIEALQEEKKAAEEFIRLGNAKKRAKASILKLELDESKKKMEENREKLKKIKEITDSIDEKARLMDEKIAESEKARAKIESELFEKQEESFREIGSKIEALKGEKNLLGEKSLSAKRKLADNSAREESLSRRLDELKEESKKEEERLREIAAEKKEAVEELKIALKELEELGERAKEKQGKTKELESRVEELEIEVEKKQSLLTEKIREFSATEKHNSLGEKEIIETEKVILGLKPFREKTQKLKEKIRLLEAKKLNELLESADKNIERFVELEKTHQAKAAELADSLKELKKEIAQCPVCDADLPALKKKKLAEKKESLERKELFEAKQALKEIVSQKNKRIELRKEIESLSELKQEFAVSNERLESMKSLEEKLAGVKKALIPVSGKKEEIEKLEKELDKLKLERNEKNSLLSSIKTDKRTIELNSRKSEFENRQKMLESEEKNILEKVVSRIDIGKKSAINAIEAIHRENKELEKSSEEIAEKLAEKEKLLSDLESKSEERSKALEKDRSKKEELIARIEELKVKKESLEFDSKKKSKEMEELRIENGKFEVRISDLEEEFAEFREIRPFAGKTIKELRKELAEAEKRLEKIGAVNLRAAESLDGEKTELLEVKAKMDKLEEEREAIIEMIQKIEFKRNNVFMECFTEVKNNFSTMFYNFFDGQGNLSLTEEDNPTISGLLIEAKHKGENLQNIDSMSGGEKTLTALAFIFSILKYAPAPFYFFDEADAALDDVNSIRMSRVIKDMSLESQFVAITHNNTLIKKADQIIGVTVGKEKSSVIGLNLKEKIQEKNSSAD